MNITVKNTKGLLLVTALAVIVCNVLIMYTYPRMTAKLIQKKTTNCESENGMSSKIVPNKLAKVRECLSKSLPRVQRLWNVLHLHIRSCSRSVFTESLDFMYFHTDKCFLKLKNAPLETPSTAPNSGGQFDKAGVVVNKDSWRTYHSCVSLTLGIGGETTFEKELHGRYRNCEFHGADPTPGVSQDFLRYGSYHVVAVDDASVQDRSLEILNNSKGIYRRTTTTTKELGEFLEEDVRRPVIHFVSMDIEGAEYRVMPYLVRQVLNKTEPQKLSKWVSDMKTPVICQLLIELHGNWNKYNMTHKQFNSIVSEFFMQSDFVPIIAFPLQWHQKILAFNANEEGCIELFSWEPEPKPWNEVLYDVNEMKFTESPLKRFSPRYPQ